MFTTGLPGTLRVLRSEGHTRPEIPGLLGPALGCLLASRGPERKARTGPSGQGSPSAGAPERKRRVRLPNSYPGRGGGCPAGAR